MWAFGTFSLLHCVNENTTPAMTAVEFEVAHNSLPIMANNAAQRQRTRPRSRRMRVRPHFRLILPRQQKNSSRNDSGVYAEIQSRTSGFGSRVSRLV